MLKTEQDTMKENKKLVTTEDDVRLPSVVRHISGTVLIHKLILGET